MPSQRVRDTILRLISYSSSISLIFNVTFTGFFFTSLPTLPYGLTYFMVLLPAFGLNALTFIPLVKNESINFLLKRGNESEALKEFSKIRPKRSDADFENLKRTLAEEPKPKESRVKTMFMLALGRLIFSSTSNVVVLYFIARRIHSDLTFAIFIIESIRLVSGYFTLWLSRIYTDPRFFYKVAFVNSILLAIYNHGPEDKLISVLFAFYVFASMGYDATSNAQMANVASRSPWMPAFAIFVEYFARFVSVMLMNYIKPTSSLTVKVAVISISSVILLIFTQKPKRKSEIPTSQPSTENSQWHDGAL